MSVMLLFGKGVVIVYRACALSLGFNTVLSICPISGIYTGGGGGGGHLLRENNKLRNWASEASPRLGCSIEISRDICCRYVCRMSN